MSKRSLLERIEQDGSIICAEGYLFEAERRGYLTSGEFVPEISLEYPEVLEQIQRDFQFCGSDIIEAFTYNGNREKMRIIGKEELLEPLNRAALKIARKVADTPPEGMEQGLMAGNISNTNIWDPEDKKVQKDVEAMFEEMCGWASEEGADMLIGETFYYAEEAYTALRVMKKFNLPCVLTIAPMGENIMRDGISPVDCCIQLEKMGADVVGMNCFRGPVTMMPYLKEIREAISCPMAALPVPFRTTPEYPTLFNLPDNNGCTCPSPHGRTFPTAMDPLYCNRYEMREFAEQAVDLGIQYLGVCCGASPAMLREVALAAGKVPPASRFQENISNHFMYGDNERIPEHMKKYGEKA